MNKNKIVFWLVAECQVDGDETDTYQIASEPIPKELLDSENGEGPICELESLFYQMVSSLKESRIYGNRERYTYPDEG